MRNRKIKIYQVIIVRENTQERILTTINKEEAELVYDGYKDTHCVALLESDMQF